MSSYLRRTTLAAINSIWSLGEIGNPVVIDRLSQLYNSSDEVLKINIVISIGKTKTPKAIKILSNLANSPQETDIVRAASWEMIDYINGVEK